MTRKEYVLNQFRRTWNKKYENYCIERLIFKLDNPNLQFVTQQMFRRNEGHIALADLYFPQIKVIVEIDEEYHRNQKEKDKDREKDIENRLSHLETVVPFEPTIIRIDAGADKEIEDLDSRIDEVANEINSRIDKCTKLEWRVEGKSIDDYVEQGVIRDDEEASFRILWEVSELFKKGYKYGSQNAYFDISKAENTYAWCPKLQIEGLNINSKYKNEISTDTNYIYESVDEDNKRFVEGSLDDQNLKTETRFTFPKYKLATGENRYVFKGVYKFDVDMTKKLGKRVWKKVSHEIDIRKIRSDI